MFIGEVSKVKWWRIVENKYMGNNEIYSVYKKLRDSNSNVR